MKKFLCSAVILLSFLSSSYAEKKPDLDLTKFNSVMLYSGLFNIMSNPAAYEGKVIKIRGMFDVFHDDEINEDFFAVVIMDDSACCTLGIDFVLRDSQKRKYPEDYPEAGDVITVTGRFELYREGDDLFCRLSDSEMI